MPKTGFKSLEQIDFAECFERIEKLGYTRADVSRELHISRAAITNFLKAKRNPSPRTLADIRAFAERIESAKKLGAVLDRKFDSMDRLKEQLEFLEKNDPPSFEAARATIDALHRGVSSNPLSEHEERALSGAAAAKHLARSTQEYGKKRKAASTTGNKSGPGGAGPANPK